MTGAGEIECVLVVDLTEGSGGSGFAHGSAEAAEEVRGPREVLRGEIVIVDQDVFDFGCVEQKGTPGEREDAVVVGILSEDIEQVPADEAGSAGDHGGLSRHALIG